MFKRAELRPQNSRIPEENLHNQKPVFQNWKTGTPPSGSQRNSSQLHWQGCLFRLGALHTHTHTPYMCKYWDIKRARLCVCDGKNQPHLKSFLSSNENLLFHFKSFVTASFSSYHSYYCEIGSSRAACAFRRLNFPFARSPDRPLIFHLHLQRTFPSSHAERSLQRHIIPDGGHTPVHAGAGQIPSFDNTEDLGVRWDRISSVVPQCGRLGDAS